MVVGAGEESGDLTRRTHWGAASRTKAHIPPELQAPITSEVEDDVRNHVARYGGTVVCVFECDAG